MFSEKSRSNEETGTATPAAESVPIQRKLTVGAINDPLEHEADAVADQVMRMPEPVPMTAVGRGGTTAIQRKCSGCEEKEKAQRKPLASFIQKKGAEGGTASDGVSSQITATRGSGSSMDKPTRSFMESRFGSDFSDIKIHTGSYATEMSQELNAQAFTVGNDIYFNSGKYSPESADGKHLLAHELTHTVQQGQRIDKKIQKLGANPGCTPGETKKIHQAIFDARGWINNALAKIDQSPRHARVLPSLRKNFGPTYGVEANLPLISGRIRAAYRSLGIMSVACDTPGTTAPCVANHCGWTNGAGSNDVTLCTNPVSTLDIAPPFGIHCVLHESFHAAMSFMSLDHYVEDADYPGAKTDPLLNADSYTQFVQELS